MSRWLGSLGILRYCREGLDLKAKILTSTKQQDMNLKGFQCPFLRQENQRLTYGVVSEGVFAESLWKFCGKFADNTFYCARKGCGNSAESLRKFHGNLRKIFWNDPFPNDPISVVLRERHININFLVRLLLGHPRECPGDKPGLSPGQSGLSQGQTQVFSLLYTVEAQFVPGTNPVCPGDIPGTKGGRKSLCVKSLCAFFVPYFLKRIGPVTKVVNS